MGTGSSAWASFNAQTLFETRLSKHLKLFDFWRVECGTPSRFDVCCFFPDKCCRCVANLFRPSSCHPVATLWLVDFESVSALVGLSSTRLNQKFSKNSTPEKDSQFFKQKQEKRSERSKALNSWTLLFRRQTAVDWPKKVFSSLLTCVYLCSKLTGEFFS